MSPLLEPDPFQFRSHFNRRPFFVKHNLSGLPLFSLERLVELATRLDPHYVDYNAGNIPKSIEYSATPKNGLSIEETIERIENHSSWMVIKRVEQDPEYSDLLNRCLDVLHPHCERLDPGMYDRAGAVFISSPGSVTPYHMDEEYNFLVQLRGTKTIHVFDASDRSILSDREIERYYRGPRIDRNLVFREEYQKKAYVMESVPGLALHIPSMAPHWVKNGPGVSISFSLGFLTRSSYRRQIVCSTNRALRDRGYNPRPFERSPLVDTAKFRLFCAMSRPSSPITGVRLGASTERAVIPGKSGDLTCEIVSKTDRLRLLVPAWREILKESATNEPTLSPDWLLAWWRVYGGDGRTLRLCLFFCDGKPIGLMPIALRTHWYRRGLPFRRFELIGDGERGLDRVFSDYLGPVIEAGFEERVARAFVDLLRSSRLGRWDELVFDRMDGTRVFPLALKQAFDASGISVDFGTTDTAAYIRLPGSWDEYLRALSPSGRYMVRRSIADFDKWAGNDVQVAQVKNEGQLKDAWQRLADLHRERWSSSGESSLFSASRFTSFHQQVMPWLLAEGALDLLTLSVRGEALAAVYNIVWNNKVYFYQSGRKVDVPKGIRPGVVLHTHAIRKAIELGRREYDFLGGPARYKEQMSTSSRPLVRLRAVQPSIRNQILSLTNPLIEGVRRWRST